MTCLYLDIDFIVSITRTFLPPLAFLPLFSTLFSEEEEKISISFTKWVLTFSSRPYFNNQACVRLCEKGGDRGKDPDGHH